MKAHIQRDKTRFVEFLKKWTKKCSSTSVKRSVRLDGGGELGRNNRIINILQDAGHTVQLTAPDSSSENGAVERPHRTIANGLRAMLHGAGLPMKFWPYALQHFVLLNNCVPHGDCELPPLQYALGSVLICAYYGCSVAECTLFPLMIGKPSSKCIPARVSSSVFAIRFTMRFTMISKLDGSRQRNMWRLMNQRDITGNHHRICPSSKTITHKRLT